MSGAYYVDQWSDANARATGCNSTLQAALQAALQVPRSEGAEYTGAEYLATWACRFSGNAEIAQEARALWPKLNMFGYYPSLGFAIFALVVFGISGLAHLYQMIRSRRWAFFSVICAVGLEMTGWVFRAQASGDIMYGYVLQLAMLTVGPTFFAGGVYALFYMFASTQDRHLMPLLGPKAFSWTIFWVEIVTIAIQAAGGGIAASVAGRSNYLLGTHIMTAGTSLQLATSLAFTTVFAIFFVRYRRSIAAESLSLRNNVGRIFWGIAVMELLIIVRGSYRIAELAGGLYGSIATNQAALIVCDAIPMLIVSILLNLVHPMWTLKRERSTSNKDKRSASVGSETVESFEFKPVGRESA